MSDNPQDRASSGEQSPPPIQQPTPPPSTLSIPQSQIPCSHCGTVVPMGTAYCPQCGFAIPPPTPLPTAPVPAAPPARNITRIIIAVVLVAVLAGGVGGYLLYQNNRQQLRTNEANAANQAVNQFQFACFTNITDRSTLYGTSKPYRGYVTLYETFGIYNPSKLKINATWTINIDYPSAGWALSNSQSFYLAPLSSAKPTFAFVVTSTEINDTPPSANFAQFTVTLSGSYTITGAYGTYNPNSHSTYDSTTNSGTGILASPLPFSKC